MIKFRKMSSSLQSRQTLSDWFFSYSTFSQFTLPCFEAGRDSLPLQKNKNKKGDKNPSIYAFELPLIPLQPPPTHTHTFPSLSRSSLFLCLFPNVWTPSRRPGEGGEVRDSSGWREEWAAVGGAGCHPRGSLWLLGGCSCISLWSREHRSGCYSDRKRVRANSLGGLLCMILTETSPDGITVVLLIYSQKISLNTSSRAHTKKSTPPSSQLDSGFMLCFL